MLSFIGSLFAGIWQGIKTACGIVYSVVHKALSNPVISFTLDMMI